MHCKLDQLPSCLCKSRLRPNLRRSSSAATRRALHVCAGAFAPNFEQDEREPSAELAFLDAHASPLAEDPVVQAQILSKSKRSSQPQPALPPQPRKHASKSPQPQQQGPTITLYPPKTQSVPPSDPTSGLDSVQGRLTRLLIKAGDVQQLSKVVRRHVSAMGEEPLVAALGKLAIWSRSQEGDAGQASSSSVQTGAGSTAELPNFTSKSPPGGRRPSRPGLTQTGSTPGPQPNTGMAKQTELHKVARMLLKEIVCRGPERMHSRHLAKAIWACALLKCCDPRLMNPLTEAAALRAGEFEDRSLANILYAMAIQPSMQVEHGLLVAVTSAVHPALKRFSPQALSNTVWALTRLRCKPSEGWWQEFLEHSYDLMPKLNGQQFANILWALYKANCMPDPGWTANCLKCLRRAMHRGMLNSRDLPNVAWALANLDVRVDRAFLDSLSAATQQCMHSIDESGLCGLGYAMARLAKRASDSPQGQQEDASQHHEHRLTDGTHASRASSNDGTSTSRGSKNTAHIGKGSSSGSGNDTGKGSEDAVGARSALHSELDCGSYSPSSEWCTAYLEATERVLPRLSVLQVTEVIVAASELGLRPHPSWLEAYTARLDSLGLSLGDARKQQQQQHWLHQKQGSGGLPVWRVRALQRALARLRQAAAHNLAW